MPLAIFDIDGTLVDSRYMIQTANLVEAYKDAFITMRRAGEESEPLYDGTADLLTGLKSGGWNLGVATGKSRRGLDAVMKREGWFDIFDCSFCADDGPGKPHPHMVNANLSALSVNAQNAVIIGDTLKTADGR